jgi:hypothetical protein
MDRKSHPGLFIGRQNAQHDQQQWLCKSEFEQTLIKKSQFNPTQGPLDLRQ